MLSEISHPSKRMGKLKKYKNKVKDSGFDFLLQSLERDKENHAPNHLTAHQQLAHSIQIDPLLTAPVHSFTLNHYPPSAKPPFYLENVKLLDRSDITVSDNNRSIPSRKSRKGREASSKSRNARRQGRREGSGRSKRSDDGQYQELIYKMKQYLTITDDILSDIDTSRWKFGKKAKNISKELVSLITAIEGGGGLGHSVKTTSFNMYQSQVLPSSSPFVKRINGLEVEREKLHSLISQHEMANIKMYVKLNEGESEQIQQCKKQLAMLFEKYKQLEALVAGDKKKIAEMGSEKAKTAKQCQELTEQNIELMAMVQKLQDSLEIHHKSKQQKGEKIAPIRVSMLRPDSHLREQSYPSFLENSEASRGQLRIESLQNSVNQSYSDEIVPLSSSITTSTSRPNRKGGRLGINLNSLLENLTTNQAQRMAQDPERLKGMMRQCRQTILKMEGIITEQNKQLELSIKALEDLQAKLKGKEQALLRLEDKMAALRQAEKEQSKKRKENKCSLNDSGSKGKRGVVGGIRKEDRRVQVDDKGKVMIDGNFKKAKYDEYRIIAMQALALEEAIKDQRLR